MEASNGKTYRYAPRSAAPRKVDGGGGRHTRELIAQSHQNLVDFLKIDLHLGMEFAKLAQTRKKGWDTAGYKRRKNIAMRVLEDAADLERLVPAESKGEIESLRAELEQFLSVI